LFGRAGIITDNIFEVLGQQSPYVSNGEPVVLDMIDKVKSIDDLLSHKFSHLTGDVEA
jgi:hypothetical protein